MKWIECFIRMKNYNELSRTFQLKCFLETFLEYKLYYLKLMIQGKCVAYNINKYLAALVFYITQWNWILCIETWWTLNLDIIKCNLTDFAICL